jgi:hypothetical protein
MFMKDYSLMMGGIIITIFSAGMVLGYNPLTSYVRLISVNLIKHEVTECVAYRDEYQKKNPIDVKKVKENNGAIKNRCQQLGVNIDDM